MHTHLCTQACTLVLTHGPIHTDTRMHTCAHTDSCTHTHAHLLTHGPMHTHAHLCLYTDHAHTHVHLCSHTDPCTQAHMHICSHTDPCTHTHAHLCSCTDLCTQKHRETHTAACVHTFMHTHTHTDTLPSHTLPLWAHPPSLQHRPGGAPVVREDGDRGSTAPFREGRGMGESRPCSRMIQGGW